MQLVIRTSTTGLSLNPEIESLLSQRLWWQTKIAEGFYFAGKENPPEVLLTQQEKEEVEAFIESHEPQPLRPIDPHRLADRIKNFASTFHFAFGDVSNREVAIAMWGRALCEYPEFAIKAALDEITTSYDGKKPLVPGMVVAKIVTHLRQPRNPYAKYRTAVNAAKLFHDSRSREQYIADREKEKLNVEAERVAFLGTLEEKKREREREEEAEALKLKEAQEIRLIARKEQAAKLKATAQTLKDEKELDELSTRFWEIVARIEREKAGRNE